MTYPNIGAVKRKVAPKKVAPKTIRAVKRSTAIVKALPPKSKAVVKRAQQVAVRKAVVRPGTLMQKAARALKAVASVNVRAASIAQRTAKKAPAKKNAAVVKALPPKSRAVVRQQQATAIKQVNALPVTPAVKQQLAQRAVDIVNQRAADTVADVTNEDSFEQPEETEVEQDQGEDEAEPEPTYMEPAEDQEIDSDPSEDMEAEFDTEDNVGEPPADEERYTDDEPPCVGCEEKSPMLANPNGFWVKTHFYREGDWLCATVYTVAAGEPKIVELRVSLVKALEFVKRAHSKLHSLPLDDRDGGQVSGCVGCDIWKSNVGGIFGSLYKAAKSVAKSKLIKKVGSVVKTVAKAGKTVLRSKVTGGVLAGLAVVMPVVGAPALAGYAAANVALSALEKGHAVAKSALATVNKAKALGRPVVVSPVVKAASVKAVVAANQAKKIITGLQTAAASHPDPKKRLDAQTTLKIVALTAQAREKLKTVAAKSPESTTGLVIDAAGNVLQGKFIEAQNAKGALPHLFLAAKGKTTRGYFQKVGGCIGCGG